MRNKIGNMKLTVKRVHITCGMTAVKEATAYAFAASDEKP